MNRTTKRQFKTHNYRGVDMKRCHGGYYTEGRSLESGKLFTVLLAVNLNEMRDKIDKVLSHTTLQRSSGYFIVKNDSDAKAVQDSANYL
jgi:hypothetical protein